MSLITSRLRAVFRIYYAHFQNLKAAGFEMQLEKYNTTDFQLYYSSVFSVLRILNIPF